jgi:hypothetical protein
MRAFLRNNIAVVFGLSLPILVVVFFLVANRVPRAFVAPPEYDLLLVSRDGQYDPRPFRVEIGVDDHRVRARVFKVDYAGNPAAAYANIRPRLFRWSHATKTVREIPLALPDDVDSIDNGDDLVIEDLANVPVSTDFRAPDGYELREPGYDRGPFGWIFGGGPSRRVVAKHGAAHELEMPNGIPYWNVQFLGWVVEQR